MRSIRCGRGFGDSLYLQSVVRHMLKEGWLRMRVASDWPDVFAPLGQRVEVMPFTRRVDIVAHYVTRKGVEGTTQFQDCCIKAGITGDAELKLDWSVGNAALAARLKESGKPILVVQMPRSPMARTDGFGKNILPDCRAIQKLIDEAKNECFVVQIGAGAALFKLNGIDLDLANRTSVAETIDVVASCDRVLGYPSFLVPLAESLDKPGMFVWSARGLRDAQPFIRHITPAKLLHKSTSRFVIDEELVNVL